MLTYKQIIESYIKKHPYHLGLTIGCAALLPVESLLSPMLIGKFGRSIAQQDTPSVVKILCGIGVLNGLSALLSDIDSVVVNDISSSMREHVSSEVLNFFLQHNKKLNGTLENTKIINEINALASASVYYNRSLLEVAPSLIALVAQAGILLPQDPVLGLCLAVLAVGAIGLTIGAHFGYVSELTDQHNTRADLMRDVDEVLTNAPSIVNADQIHMEILKIISTGKEARKMTAKAVGKSLLFTASLSVLTAIMSILFLTRLNRLTRTQAPGFVEHATKNLTVLLRAVDNVNRISSKIPSLAHNWNLTRILLDDINELAVTESQVVENRIVDEEKMELVDFAVEFVDMSLQFSTWKLFDHFHLTLAKKTLHVITGPVGCGKSTLLKLVAGFIPFDSGQVCVVGKTGYVPQSPVLFDRSLYANLVYGTDPETVTEETVSLLLSGLGLTFDLPLNESVGKGGNLLSGGQRQMVLIVRQCLRTDLATILLDEPTSGLDTAFTEIFLQLLTSAICDHGKTVLLVTHDQHLLHALEELGEKIQRKTHVLPTTSSPDWEIKQHKEKKEV